VAHQPTSVLGQVAGCPPHVLAAIYGAKPTAEQKRKVYEASLQRCAERHIMMLQHSTRLQATGGPHAACLQTLNVLHWCAGGGRSMQTGRMTRKTSTSVIACSTIAVTCRAPSLRQTAWC
jgi:hypothetical protein